MVFEINNSKWLIKEISQEEMQYSMGEEGKYTHGITIYSENTIYINETSPEKERTLKHELTHVWLYMYGHNQQDKEFNYEDVCEIVACSNDFINYVIGKYRKEK